MNTSLSRRAFVRGAALGATSLTLLPQSDIQAQKSPYGPFRMGIQSYSLRHFKVEEALAKTQSLGLKFWEAYPGHLPLTANPKQIAAYKEMLKACDIKLAAYGVLDFSADEKDARAKFEFAKAMGIETISAYPRPDSLNLLDRLTQEYRINIGIHNHGPGDDLYDKIEKGIKAMEGRGARIGSCADTGHYLRSNENPVEAVKQFGKRVHGIHLKDVKTVPNGEKRFTEMGRGEMDTVGLLRALRVNRFRGVLALEYEEHEQEPMPYIAECLGATREAIQKMLTAR
jgi:sugar phosphate isomerase/epimerase